MTKKESEAPIRLPSAAQVKALFKEGARVKEKMSEISGTYGDRVKSAIENGNLHGAAFGKAKSIYNKSRTNELAALEQMQVTVPIVVRLSGTNAKEGLEILRHSNLTVVESMTKAANTAIALAEI